MLSTCLFKHTNKGFILKFQSNKLGGYKKLLDLVMLLILSNTLNIDSMLNQQLTYTAFFDIT